ncbi:MAG: alpha/beta hydrolase [bacterium]|nr:alpha/beta hydrolase [bacterium]
MNFIEEGIIRENYYVDHIPAIIWGEKAKKAYIYVHGKMSWKESAEEFAKIASKKGYQTISFDLPEHGERAQEDTPCDIWNGVDNLNQIADYASQRWDTLSLYACSIGAHFSLYAYQDRSFLNCLFQSPILDIEYLIGQIFKWYHITPEMLREQRVIDTTLHKLSWDYYMYVKEHPIKEWRIPTCILYAGHDVLQSREVMQQFCRNYEAQLTVAEDSDHGFAQGNDIQIEKEWLNNMINE